MMEELARAPLNKAHILDRSAETYARKQLFEKAIQCREQAIEHLLAVKTNHLMNESVRSLNDQIASHQHRIRLLKEMHQNSTKRARVSLSKVDSSPVRTSIPETPYDTAPRGSIDSNISSALELAIRTEISKGDKLLETLVSQKSENDLVHGKNDALITSAIKLPKPTEQVLEELQLHNSQLKNLVFGLLEEVESLKEENGRLRLTITQLEGVKDSTDMQRNATTSRAAISEKSKSVDTTFATDSVSGELPPLEPFEMPQISVGVKPRIKVGPRKSRTSE
ncbi:nuclear receptor-binding factor 2-like [Paramacrobiotus metropolitanus]|uniref:nuclear receptor-binding factor 2-like n=1 Tax=Paramacrobiotus metropolitanus TaxID=2943436 RepID=UPI0024462C40|nr:nuclear receptor-binding factor 2-like [Paramacrobiotus metropolitanus]